jgi:sensor histidine kinase YesM
LVKKPQYYRYFFVFVNMLLLKYKIILFSTTWTSDECNTRILYLVKCSQCYLPIDTVYSDTCRKSLIAITNAVLAEIHSKFKEHIWKISHKELLTRPQHSRSFQFYCEVRAVRSLFVWLVYFRSLFVLFFFFLFAFVLSVLRFTSSDYLIGFFKLFYLNNSHPIYTVHIRHPLTVNILKHYPESDLSCNGGRFKEEINNIEQLLGDEDPLLTPSYISYLITSVPHTTNLRM